MSKAILILGITLASSLSSFACMDLTGVYELREDSCEEAILPELSLPTNSGKIQFKKHDVVSINQKKCDELSLSIQDENESIANLELTKRVVPNFQFSKYGIIISEELKKVKNSSEMKPLPGRKITINSQWNLDLIGNGNLVLKFKQDIRNHTLFNRKVKDLKQVCELFKLAP
jgi:hypothetical protein